MSEKILTIREKSMYPGKGLEIVKVTGDEEAIHFGYFQDENILGVISLFNNDESQIRKMAVLPSFQGKGIGSN